MTLRKLVVLGALVVAATAGIASPPSTAPANVTPTRLVHGPVVFRVTGHADPDTVEGRYRYEIVFKLNRDPRTKVTDEDLARGIDGPRGNYSMLNHRIVVGDECCLPEKFRNVRNCFFTYVGTDYFPSRLRLLDRIRVGQRLNVRIQPLTPSTTGRAKLGKRYDVRATMRLADVKLRSSSARRALRRIGCLHG